MSEETRSLARITQAEIGDVYNGMVGLCVTFEYEDGFCQRLGSYVLEAAFVIRFMRAVGVNKLADAVGRSCWITHGNTGIFKIEPPFHRKDGQPFVIAEWQEWMKRRMPSVSYSEMETGVDPEETAR